MGQPVPFRPVAKGQVGPERGGSGTRTAQAAGKQRFAAFSGDGASLHPSNLDDASRSRLPLSEAPLAASVRKYLAAIAELKRQERIGKTLLAGFLLVPWAVVLLAVYQACR